MSFSLKIESLSLSIVVQEVLCHGFFISNVAATCKNYCKPFVLFIYCLDWLAVSLLPI